MMSYTWIRGMFLTSNKIVYHRTRLGPADRGGRSVIENDGVFRSRTDCGIVTFAGGRSRGVHLSEVLAHRIARPCLRCYPERRVP
jgi:hypothetical protein